MRDDDRSRVRRRPATTCRGDDHLPVAQPLAVVLARVHDRNVGLDPAVLDAVQARAVELARDGLLITDRVMDAVGGALSRALGDGHARPDDLAVVVLLGALVD